MTSIQYRVFFPPRSLSIVVDRPDKGSGYDRTIDFEMAKSSANNRRRLQEDVRIVVATEMVRIRCEAGKPFFLALLTNGWGILGTKLGLLVNEVNVLQPLHFS